MVTVDHKWEVIGGRSTRVVSDDLQRREARAHFPGDQIRYVGDGRVSRG